MTLGQTNNDFEDGLAAGLHLGSWTEIKAQDLAMPDEVMALVRELVPAAPSRWLITEREPAEIGLVWFRVRDADNQLSFGRRFRVEAGREADSALEVALWIEQRC